MRLIRCIRCDDTMPNIDPRGHQPHNGLEFISYGHYGSRVFDPMDGTFVAIAVCDGCLTTLLQKRRLLAGEKEVKQKITYKKWVLDK